MHPVIAIAMGSNVGDRFSTIRRGLDLLGHCPGCRVVAVSDLIETAPVGPKNQGYYLNGAALLDTTLDPRSLLEAMLDVERRLGRDRSSAVRWGPRTLDLDLILYLDQVINDSGLRVPHPRLAERAFVLDPLAQIAPNGLVPGVEPAATVAQLAQSLRRTINC